jgi:hypothetical protein
MAGFADPRPVRKDGVVQRLARAANIGPASVSSHARRHSEFEQIRPLGEPLVHRLGVGRFANGEGK